MSLVLLSGDDHFLLVLALSLVLCLTVLCLLVRAYGTKYRYRRKEKEIQRPFLKGSRGPRSPRSAVLFGNLFTSVQAGRTPKGHQYVYPLTGKHLRPLVNTSVFNGKPQTSRIAGRSFLADVITSIDQQHHKHLCPVEMEKRLAQRSKEPKVLSTSPYVKEKSKEKQKSNPKCEQDDRQNDTTTKKPLHSIENSRESVASSPSSSAVTCIKLKQLSKPFTHCWKPNPKDKGMDSHKSRSNPKCEQDDTAKACVTTEDFSGKFFDSLNDTTTKKPLHSTENPRESVASSPSSSTVTCSKLNQLSNSVTHFLKPKSKDKQMDSHKSRSIFYVDLPLMQGSQDVAHKHGSLWAHSCDEEKQAERTIERDSRKPPVSAKSGMKDNFELTEEASLLSNKTGKGKSSKGFGKVAPPWSSKNQSIKDDDLSITNNYCRQGKSHKKKERKNSKPSDQRESEACTHKVPKGNDIVTNASKSQVLCKLCGIKLSKPQCFYSLGSLCTDGEYCETDSDDVNRHPVGDIDDFPLLPEPQSHQDTGYTSSDDFENDNRSSMKECGSVQGQNKAESNSYDGDYESGNDETGLRLDKMSDDVALKPVVSVGEPIPIKDYALQEWKSDTPTSRTMKKGYDDILSRTKCQYLRRIRGDNYCAIRSVLFQMLAAQCSIKNLFARDKIAKLESIPRSLAEVDHWSFANRLPVSQSEVVETLEKFLAFFKEKICKVLDISSQPERVEHILSLFNNEPEEFQLLEATKLLMYDAAVQLNKKLSRGEDVPVFSMLLFARDSCESPRDLLLNHLNKTGDTGGLEQVEMCLLGFTLGVVIRVIRPSQVDEEDFMAYYPALEEMPNYTPTVTLVAEDDRHYNVVM